MADEVEKSALERIVEILHRHRVEYVIIGGQAEILHGGARVTFDVDVSYRRTRENLERLAAALREIKPTLRGAPPDLPFRLDAQALALGSNFTFETPFGNFDLLGFVEPFGEYDTFASRAEPYTVADIPVLAMHLDDLIAVKRHLHRPKDRDSLMQLLAIKRIRDESSK